MAQFRCLLMVTSFLLGYARSTNSDYLLQGITSSAHATITSDDTSLTLSNGLISRVFSLPKHPGQLMQCKPWYCSKWCNTAGKWGCGNATPPPPFDVECSCNGCNGCPGAPPVLPPISAGFPAFATIDLLQLAESPAGLHKSALRSFSPEAVITLDNITYPVGGFQTFNNTSPNLPSNYATNSFLNRSSAALVERACILPGAFIYTGHTTAPMAKRFNWTIGTRHSGTTDIAWPPRGEHLVVSFKAPAGAPAAHQGITVEVHYELYDGVPAFAKWVSLRSKGKSAAGVKVQDIAVEMLAINDEFSPINFATVEGGAPPVGLGLIEASTDQAHGPGCSFTTHPEGTWAAQPVLGCSYGVGFGAAQTGNSFCHPLASPPEVCSSTGEQCPSCGQVVCPCPKGVESKGLDVSIKAASLVSGLSTNGGEKMDIHADADGHLHFFHHKHGDDDEEHTFESFHARILLHDSFERERRGLATRRLAKVVTPHILENPIFLHLSNQTSDTFRAAVDQCVEVGFEMIIYSFGSGFNLESNNSTYMDQIASDVAYAKSKGIEVGGYDLIVEDRGPGGYGKPNVPEKFAAISPATGNSTADACYASGWADELETKIHDLMAKAGLTMLETDGPYGGAPCASSAHAHHTGLSDSIFFQTRLQERFYTKMKGNGDKQ